jgi:hypothetical protein
MYCRVEIVLLRPLHLDNKFFPLLVFAVEIENSPTVILTPSDLLIGQKREVCNYPRLGRKQGIQKRYQQVFVYLRTEKLLEAKVGEGVDVTIF